MNYELNQPLPEDDHSEAGEESRRRSRSDSSPASGPRGEGVPVDSDVAPGGGAPLPSEAAELFPPSLPDPLDEVEDEQLDWDGGAGFGQELPQPPVGDPSAEGRESEDQQWEEPLPLPPNLTARKRRTLSKKELPPRPQMPLSPQQKLLLLDTWQRSGLPARDFGALVNISRHTLYAWKRRFEELGPAGLMEQPRGTKRGSKLPELTKRTILMLKQAHPDWGCQRISDMLTRGPALPASPTAVARVLREAGYEMEEVATRPHPDKVRSFERARPNQLWQTDLFTFMLKRQNRRVYLVAFMDDHSRFITGYGLHASQSATLVIEVLRTALGSYGVPAEILTDNGTQYVTWRGKSQFTRELEKHGVKQIVARPRRPQTLGKIERFWGTLWRECLEASVFQDMADARQRIGLFIDYYNLQRPHQGIEGLVPADRFFDAAPEVLKTLKARVAANALELARQGVPKQPFYLTGQLDGKPFSVHREGDRVILRQAGQDRQEVDLVPPEQDEVTADAPAESDTGPSLPTPVTPDGSPQTSWNPPDQPLPPGLSALDGFLTSMTAPLSTPAEPPSEESSLPRPADDPVDEQEGGVS